MNSYISLTYLFFFLPLTMFCYQITKKEYRYLILLGASLFCFYLFSRLFVIYLILLSLFTYLIAKIMTNLCEEEKIELALASKEVKKAIKKEYLKKKNHLMTLQIILIVFFILLLKYSSFIVTNINGITNLSLPVFSFIVPIGLSFYSLEMISYIVDLKRGKIEACQNYLKLLLYFAYFPKLMEGPISTYHELKDELYQGKDLQVETCKEGIIRILLGIMKKMVVADRLNYAIEHIFHYYHRYDAPMMLFGAIIYTIQLYCEFSGIMDVVIGTSSIFHIHLFENFRQPFFAMNISEFWQRWHISLGRFFKEYIYFPISMSKLSKKMITTLKKKVGNYYSVTLTSGIALFVVWITNGFWHGAGNQYGLFGLYHFLLIYISSLNEPLKKKIRERLKINEKSKIYHGYRSLITFFFVCIGEMIFRSMSGKDAIKMLKILLTKHTFHSNYFASLKLDLYDIVIVIIILVVIGVISYQKEKGKQILSNQSKSSKWVMIYVLIFAILIFGAYGNNYIPLDPIYANF